MPKLATLMTAGFLASLGLPGLVSFAAEFSIFYAIYSEWNLLFLIPMVSVALTAAYYLWALQRSMFGPLTTKIETKDIHDAYWYEYAPMAVLVALIALFGIFPMIMISKMGGAITLLFNGLGVG